MARQYTDSNLTNERIEQTLNTFESLVGSQAGVAQRVNMDGSDPVGPTDITFSADLAGSNPPIRIRLTVETEIGKDYMRALTMSADMKGVESPVTLELHAEATHEVISNALDSAIAKLPVLAS